MLELIIITLILWALAFVIGALMGALMVVFGYIRATIFFLLSNFRDLLFPLTVASLPAWGAGLAVGFLILFAIRQQRLNSLCSPKTLAKLVTLSLDGQKLNCSLNYSELRSYAKSRSAAALTVVACIASTTAILAYLMIETTAFRGHKLTLWNIAGHVADLEPISETTSLIIASIIATVSILCCLKMTPHSRLFIYSIKNKVDQLVCSSNLSLKTSDELQSLIRQIAEVSAKLTISFPEEYVSSIYGYVESRKAEILINRRELERHISFETSRAKDDLSQLEKADKSFDDAMRLYFRTASQVNKVGNITCFHLLDQLLKGLGGSKAFLPKREWTKFHENIDYVTSELQLLYENADRYDETIDSGVAGRVPSDPFQVLGVTEQMGTEQIKKIYRLLCEIYHPDKGKVSDHKKFVEIDKAYKEIKRLKDIK